MNQLLYKRLTQFFAPFLPLWLRIRCMLKKEDKARLQERFGYASIKRSNDKLIWLHGVSIGEVTVLSMLQKALHSHYPAFSWLITSSTRSSAEIINRQIQAKTLKKCCHQYCPLDTPKAVKRFLDYWKPSLAVFSESDLWPNLLMEIKAKALPCALINARLSQKTQKNWLRHRQFASEIFSTFEHIMVADLSTKQTLEKILERDIPCFGNIKAAHLPETVRPELLKTSLHTFQNRPLWLGASTHAGEEEILLKAHHSLLKKYPNALLVLVPRHPERTGEIQNVLKKIDLSYCLRQKKENSLNRNSTDVQLPQAHHQVYLANTFGELNLFYTLSPVSVLGGSLKEKYKGHNPYEAIAFKTVILCGPHIESFQAIYDHLFAEKAAVCLNTKINLVQHIAENIQLFWDNTQKYQAYTKAALKRMQKDQNAFEKTLNTLKPLLDKESEHESS